MKPMKDNNTKIFVDTEEDVNYGFESDSDTNVNVETDNDSCDSFNSEHSNIGLPKENESHPDEVIDSIVETSPHMDINECVIAPEINSTRFRKSEYGFELLFRVTYVLMIDVKVTMKYSIFGSCSTEHDADVAKYSSEHGIFGNAVDDLFKMLKGWSLPPDIQLCGSERNLKIAEKTNHIVRILKTNTGNRCMLDPFLYVQRDSLN
jgi:hypothetical protein